MVITDFYRDEYFPKMEEIYIESVIFTLPVIWNDGSESYPIVSVAWDVATARVFAERLDKVESSHQLLGDVLREFRKAPEIILVGRGCDAASLSFALEPVRIPVVADCHAPKRRQQDIRRMLDNRYAALRRRLREDAEVPTRRIPLEPRRGRAATAPPPPHRKTRWS